MNGSIRQTPRDERGSGHHRHGALALICPVLVLSDSSHAPPSLRVGAGSRLRHGHARGRRLGPGAAWGSRLTLELDDSPRFFHAMLDRRHAAAESARGVVPFGRPHRRGLRRDSGHAARRARNPVGGPMIDTHPPTRTRTGERPVRRSSSHLALQPQTRHSGNAWGVPLAGGPIVHDETISSDP